MQRIKGCNGEWKSTSEGMQQVIEDYFVQLFKSESLNESLTEREVVQQVTAEDNLNLVKEITEEEIKEADFQCIRTNHQARMD